MVTVHDCKLRVDGISKYLDSVTFRFDHAFGDEVSTDMVNPRESDGSGGSRGVWRRSLARGAQRRSLADEGARGSVVGLRSPQRSVTHGRRSKAE